MTQERREWRAFEGFLRRYADDWNVTDVVPGLSHREGWFVVLRLAILATISGIVFWSESAALKVGLGIFAFGLLLDAVAIATAHAFIPNPKRQPDSIVRFVFLNLLSYLTLTVWLTIFLSFVADHFSPRLDWSLALEAAFAVITASAVADPADALDLWAWLVLGAGNILALYWLLVILVTAVSRVEYDKPATEGR